MPKVVPLKYRPPGLKHGFPPLLADDSGKLYFEGVSLVRHPTKGYDVVLDPTLEVGTLLPFTMRECDRDYMDYWKSHKDKRGKYFLDMSEVVGRELIFDGNPGPVKKIHYCSTVGAFANEATLGSGEHYNCMFVLLRRSEYPLMPLPFGFSEEDQVEYIPCLELMAPLSVASSALVFYGSSTMDVQHDQRLHGYLAAAPVGDALASNFGEHWYKYSNRAGEYVDSLKVVGLNLEEGRRKFQWEQTRIQGRLRQQEVYRKANLPQRKPPPVNHLTRRRPGKARKYKSREYVG